jgi:hypothetical protein
VEEELEEEEEEEWKKKKKERRRRKKKKKTLNVSTYELLFSSVHERLFPKDKRHNSYK